MAEITGTRMTAVEFSRLPETTTLTELIDGELIVSPSPKTDHQRVVLRLARLLMEAVQGGEVLIVPLDVYLDGDNVLQPDLFWVGPESACLLQDDGYWHGPPDLIIEVISPGSSRMDKVIKFNLYERHDVREYWLVDLEISTLEVWVRGEDQKFTRQGAYSGAFASVLLGKKSLDLSPLFA
jgi:Uma2 family endonuclease